MRLTDEALRAETARAVLIKPRGYKHHENENILPSV